MLELVGAKFGNVRSELRIIVAERLGAAVRDRPAGDPLVQAAADCLNFWQFGQLSSDRVVPNGDEVGAVPQAERRVTEQD